jgi:hypothetical protein
MKIPKSLLLVLLVVVVVLLVGAGVWVGINIMTGSSSQTVLSPYSAVYLSTGDIYFGKLDWSPSPHMEGAWFLQRGTDAKGNPTVGVYPFNQVAWGPSSDVYFNTQQIVFWTRLNGTSSIAQLIANPGVATTAQQSAAAAQGSQSPITTPPTSTISH